MSRLLRLISGFALAVICVLGSSRDAGAQSPEPAPTKPEAAPEAAPEGEAPARQRRMQARRARLRANLEHWNSLSPEEKNRMRRHVHRALEQEREGRERMLAKARRFEELSDEERQELRSKIEELQARRRGAGQREHVDAQRARMRAMPPEQRKRYMVLQHVIRGLPKERADELRELPKDERLVLLRQLVQERGPEFLVKQICRRAPQLESVLREISPEERRELFRAWIDSPEPSPIRFLRQRGLVPPGVMEHRNRMRGTRGDRPHRGRGPHGPRRRGVEPERDDPAGEGKEKPDPREGEKAPRDDDEGERRWF